MANEITSTFSLSVAKGNVAISKSQTNRITMSGTVYNSTVTSIPTTAAGTALSLGSVGTPGVTTFKNLDASNFVEIGVQVGGTFYPFGKLLPGEAYPWRLGTSAPYARSNTAACLLETTIVEA